MPQVIGQRAAYQNVAVGNYDAMGRFFASDMAVLSKSRQDREEPSWDKVSSGMHRRVPHRQAQDDPMTRSPAARGHLFGVKRQSHAVHGTGHAHISYQINFDPGIQNGQRFFGAAASST
jgi:hypothetical protein